MEHQGRSRGATNIKDYYRDLKASYTSKLETAEKDLPHDKSQNEIAREKVESIKEYLKREFKFDIDKFPEYAENRYIDGGLFNRIIIFYRSSKIQNDVAKRYAIILKAYAETIKRIYETNHKIALYKKVLSYSFHEYREFVKAYYYEVQRQMIVNGYAYQFSGHVGAVCINRCKNLKSRPIINTKATKENKKKLLAEGVHLYNEKEAAYCKDHGIKYDGQEYRIFMYNDWLYEFCLIWSGLPNAFRHKFEPIDYWSAENRGKHKEDFKKEANGDINYICGLDITFRTKVTICNEMDETLYLNFIRNEHQIPITSSKSYRESGQ